MMKEKGFTLIEVMVASFVFLIVIGAVIGLLTSVVQNQVSSLRDQKAVSETSYAMEYMSRSLRMAKKDEAGSCTGSLGQVYQISSGAKEITFLNHYGKCQMFGAELLAGGGLRIYERRSTDEGFGGFLNPVYITSASVYTEEIIFKQSISASGPPRITINIKAGPNPETLMNLQTTISQR